MNIYSIKSNTEKIGGGFHKLSTYFHQHDIYVECGNMNHLILLNIVAIISHKILNVTSDFMCS